MSEIPARPDIAAGARIVADMMAKLLGQEYLWHEDAWWLFSLGKLARVLTTDEVAYARGRGLIPPDADKGESE